MIKKLDSLFDELKKIVELNEMGYHQIVDGKLNPIHKTETEKISSESWKKIHSENPVYVKDNPLLTELVDNKKTIVIKNTHNDKRSSTEFSIFGIYSVMMIPVLHKSKINGFINIPSINKYYDFTEEQVYKCESIIKQYSEFL